MCQHEQQEVAEVDETQSDEKDACRGVAVYSLLEDSVPDQHRETVAKQAHDADGHPQWDTGYPVHLLCHTLKCSAHSLEMILMVEGQTFECDKKEVAKRM